eukprot:1709945-Prymnesium_polylepis.1
MRRVELREVGKRRWHGLRPQKLEEGEREAARGAAPYTCARAGGGVGRRWGGEMGGRAGSRGPAWARCVRVMASPFNRAHA